MNVHVELLGLVAEEVAAVLDKVVYFGGSVVPLHFEPDLLGDDELRPTDDVDVLVMFQGTQLEFHSKERELYDRGWHPNTSPENKLKYSMISPSRITVDLVPSFTLPDDDTCLVCLPQAVAVQVPTGRFIRVLSSGGMLAAKFAAFAERGNGDLLGSADFEDIAMLVACCPSVVEDTARLPPVVQQRIADGAAWLLQEEVLDYAIATVPRSAPIQGFVTTLRALTAMRPS